MKEIVIGKATYKAGVRAAFGIFAGIFVLGLMEGADDFFPALIGAAVTVGLVVVLLATLSAKSLVGWGWILSLLLVAVLVVPYGLDDLYRRRWIWDEVAEALLGLMCAVYFIFGVANGAVFLGKIAGIRVDLSGKDTGVTTTNKDGE